MYIAVCIVNLVRGDPRGHSDCMADAACVFYDEKINKCVSYYNTPHAELRPKFESSETCKKKCVT